MLEGQVLALQHLLSPKAFECPVPEWRPALSALVLCMF